MLSFGKFLPVDIGSDQAFRAAVWGCEFCPAGVVEDFMEFGDAVGKGAGVDGGVDHQIHGYRRGRYRW